MSLRRQVQRYGRWVAAIVAIVLVSIACGAWILVHERLQTPFDDTYDLRAQFSAAPGLVPGLGQPVNVSGVHVGAVAGRELHDGRALVTMRIDPDKLPALHEGAHATMVPNTPLGDLQVELDPGDPRAPVLPRSQVLDVARTSPPPSVDLITHALDTDTRAYFQALLSGLDEGTKGRADDLRALLRQLRPTADQLHAVGSALQGRRRELRHLVHNLSLLSASAGARDADLRRAVAAGGAVLQAVAKPEGALQRAIAQLPGTLDDADHSLGSVRTLADRLGPASDALLPVARHAPAALRAATTLSRAGTPVLRDDLRPLVSQLQPVASKLAPATHQLNQVTPSLTSAFQVLNYLMNEIGDDPPGPDRGYLFWLPWFLHNVNSFVSVSDAHGAVWRGLDEVACTTITGQKDIKKALAPVLGPLGC